jgi:flavin reductase (DIM6/NTAB) family NADH-FMN oxidoreductase RutF
VSLWGHDFTAAPAANDVGADRSTAFGRCWVTLPPITIITTAHDEVPIGFACRHCGTVTGSAAGVVCPTKVSRSWKAIEASGRFCVNMLTESKRRLGAIRIEGA